MELGIHLSAEEHPPQRLIETARQAEEAGFGFATISDHYHPWTEQQGQSPFVWTVLGCLSAATERMRYLTAVTCPTIRIHPAIIAHAAATTATVLPGRFALGLGSGENLNEHVTGRRWPAPRERLQMLEEATGVIRHLFTGDRVAHDGRHFRVEDARLYTLPDEPVPIHVAASGTTAAALAGRVADGLIVDSPDREVIDRFQERGSDDGRPVTGKLMVCWDDDVTDARDTATRWWPVGAVGKAGADLRLPSDFESVAENLDREAMLSPIVITDEVEPIVERIEDHREAGATRVSLHQIGPEQETFLGGPGRVLLERYGAVGSTREEDE